MTSTRRTPRTQSRRESFDRPLFVLSKSASSAAQTNLIDEGCIIVRASLVALSTTDGYALIRDQNATADVREVLAVDGATARNDVRAYDWRLPLYMPEGVHITLSAASSTFICTVSYVLLDDISWHGNLDDYRTDFSFMAQHAGGRIWRGRTQGEGDSDGGDNGSSSSGAGDPGGGIGGGGLG